MTATSAEDKVNDSEDSVAAKGVCVAVVSLKELRTSEEDGGICELTSAGEGSTREVSAEEGNTDSVTGFAKGNDDDGDDSGDGDGDGSGDKLLVITGSV